MNEEEDEKLLITNDINRNNLTLNKNPCSQSANYSYLDKTRNFIIKSYSYIIPSPYTSPVLCFIFIIFLTYLHTRMTLLIIEKLSSLVKLTASFLGMTLLTWGGNVGDTINASIAAKLDAPDLLTTSILGSQVMNLQLCLGLPWMISIVKSYLNGKPGIIDFGKRNPLKFCLPLFLVVMISILVLTVFKLNLNKRSGVCLIIIYICYLVYEFNHNIR